MLFIKKNPHRNRYKPCLEISHSYEIILILRITGICLELLLHPIHHTHTHTHTQHLKQAWDIMPPPSKSPIPHSPPSLLEGLVVCLGLVCLGNHKGNTVSRIRFWSDVLFFKVLLWHIAITKTYRNGKIYLTYTALCHSYYRDRRGAVILDYYWITLY